MTSGEIEVTIRGLDESGPRYAEARRRAHWIVQHSPAYFVRVLIDRCAPEWGGTTSVSIEVCLDQRRIVEVATRDDPDRAIEDAFDGSETRVSHARHLG
jgi:hypothetical protein